jgi:hypothetical protein
MEPVGSPATAALMIVGFTPMKVDERSHRDGRDEEDDG